VGRLAGRKLNAPFFYGFQKIFQPIDFDLINSSQEHSQLSFGEAFSMEPFDVGNGQVAKQGAFVFTEGHGYGDEGCQKIGIREGEGNIHAIAAVAELGFGLGRRERLLSRLILSNKRGDLFCFGVSHNSSSHAASADVFGSVRELFNPFFCHTFHPINIQN